MPTLIIQLFDAHTHTYAHTPTHSHTHTPIYYNENPHPELWRLHPRTQVNYFRIPQLGGAVVSTVVSKTKISGTTGRRIGVQVVREAVATCAALAEKVLVCPRVAATPLTPPCSHDSPPAVLVSTCPD